MKEQEEKLIRSLIKKYNNILLHSMRIAVSEDLINLIIINKEDQDSKLKEIIGNKEEFKQFVINEFLKQNSYFNK